MCQATKCTIMNVLHYLRQNGLLTLELLLSSSAHSFALRDRSLLPRRLNQTDIVSGDTLTNNLSCLNVFNYCRGNENVRASRLAARSSLRNSRLFAATKNVTVTCLCLYGVYYCVQQCFTY